MTTTVTAESKRRHAEMIAALREARNDAKKALLASDAYECFVRIYGYTTVEIGFKRALQAAREWRQSSVQVRQRQDDRKDHRDAIRADRKR